MGEETVELSNMVGIRILEGKQSLTFPVEGMANKSLGIRIVEVLSTGVTTVLCWTQTFQYKIATHSV